MPVFIMRAHGMSTTPIVTIFVRHSADCKYKGDEFNRRCKCRKHLRWSQHGTQHRRKAGTRSWEEAEKRKRDLENQLSGRFELAAPVEDARSVHSSVDVFIEDKKVQGVTSGVLGKY